MPALRRLRRARSRRTSTVVRIVLALRDDYGQAARIATNYDGLVVSLLVEAQSAGQPTRRKAGRCPLRGMRRADVATGECVRLAAVVSLALAAARVREDPNRARPRRASRNRSTSATNPVMPSPRPTAKPPIPTQIGPRRQQRLRLLLRRVRLLVAIAHAPSLLRFGRHPADGADPFTTQTPSRANRACPAGWAGVWPCPHRRARLHRHPGDGHRPALPRGSPGAAHPARRAAGSDPQFR